MIGDSRTKTRTSGTRLILMTLRLAMTALSAIAPVTVLIGPAPGRGPLVAVLRRLGGVVAGQGEEHVVERRAAEADVPHLHARVVELPQRCGQDLGPALAGHDQPVHVVVDLELAAGQGEEHVRRLLHVVGTDHHLDALPADPALQLVRRALGDGHPVVDDHDPVGQVVGLLEVLGGEQDRRAPTDQVPDHRPQVGPAAGVEAGGGLVEEQHRRLGHEGAGEVEAAPHAPGVGLDRAVGGLVEIEVLEQLPGPLPRAPPAEVVEAGDHVEVLEAGQVLVDGGELAGEPDPPADLGAARCARRPRPRWRCPRRAPAAW